MSVDTKTKPASLLLLDEYFAEGEDAFLDEILRCTADGKLKSFAGRWYSDRRPWARKMLIAYVDDGCDRPRHRVLVRALLGLAEANADDELMAHLFYAFDRMNRHEVVLRQRYDWYAREMREFRVRKQTHPDLRTRHRGPEYWQHLRAAPKKAGWRVRAPYFSNGMRSYLRRRAFRYFRSIAFKEPERYVASVLRLLALYGEEDVARPEHIIDAYGLTNILYYGSDVLRRDSRRLTIKHGRQLAEIEPAPLNPDAWRGHSEELLRFLFRSDCLYVRRWIERWLVREEKDALAALDARKLKPLLLSPYGDVQVFASELLASAEGLGTFRVADWLELLDLDNVEILTAIAALVKEYVTPERVELNDLVRLACMRAAPVAELGFSWLKDRSIPDAETLRLVMALANAEAQHVREEAVPWLLELVRGELGTPEHLRDLIDARYADVRASALTAMQEDERFRDDSTLWLALSESPYPDVIAFLVRHLEERASQLPDERVAQVWATTLLSPYRGSRAKRTALRQIAARVVEEPARADELLPILRVALRSVRETERRAALASVARAAFEEPALREAIGAQIPELELFA